MITICTRNGQRCKWFKTAGKDKYVVPICTLPQTPVALTHCVPPHIKNNQCKNYIAEQDKQYRQRTNSPFE